MAVTGSRNGEPVTDAAQPSAAAPSVAPAETEASEEFLRDLVAAMRSVADEARQSGLDDLSATADEHVKSLQAESEQRAGELRSRADRDVSGVGEWARAEAERIRAEAEQRVATRRAQLDQELAGEAKRSEQEINALRGRVSDYERELSAYYAQLAEINDPAAFASAAKRIPPAPELSAGGSSAAPQNSDVAEGGTPAQPRAVEQEVAPATAEAPQAAAVSGPHPAGPEATAEASADAGEPQQPDARGDNAPEPQASAAPPAEQPEPTAEQPKPAGPAQPSDPPRPALQPAPQPAAQPVVSIAASPAATPRTAGGEPAVTAIVVKGLGSFGAITGFRQSLAGMKGIDSVSLSLGPTGEFVYRASHAAGLDVAAAIRVAEGEGVVVEPDADGILRVTLSRTR